MARLEINGLTKRYGDHAVVRGVDLDIPDGEFLVLLGPSGCGKTTTLRMIAGFVPPSAGSIRIGSRDITALPPWQRNAGLVFQSYALFPHMTVNENVAFGLDMRHVPKADSAKRVAEALELVRLGHLGERRPPLNAGVVDQNVNRSEVGFDSFHLPPNFRRHGDIECRRADLRAGHRGSDGGRRGHELCFVAAIEHDRRPGPGETTGECKPNALTGASDERSASGEIKERIRVRHGGTGFAGLGAPATRPWRAPGDRSMKT